MRVKIEWLTYNAPGDPVADLTLGGEYIGRLYHYAQVSQIARDAKRLWEGKRV